MATTTTLAEINNLADVRRLDNETFDTCKRAAVERVVKAVGDKPTRKQFQREYAPLMGLTEWLVVVIFLSVFAVSAVHVLHFMGNEASRIYQDTAAGIQIGSGIYAVIHQLGLLLAAEFAIIVFMVKQRQETHHVQQRGRGTWAAVDLWRRRWFGLYSVLAAVSAVFVFMVNWTSGINPFIGAMVPLITIGLSWPIEAVIAEKLRRTQEIDLKYQDRLASWEIAASDPHAHRDYNRYLAQEIWQAVVAENLKKGRGVIVIEDIADAPTKIKQAAVQREMERDRWAAGDWLHSPQPVEVEAFNGHENGVNHAVPLSETVPLATAGNGHKANGTAN